MSNIAPTKRFFKELYPEPTISSDPRSDSKRDRDRILFSRAFRRLSNKTQVIISYGKVTSDHIRSRLTHSLEVMQIASAMADYLKKRNKKIKIDNSCIEAIALGHDLGHSPYGHIGEDFFSEFLFGKKFKEKINRMRHSFQSLKVCCFLEKHYKPDIYGLNLTIPVLDGILKHSSLSNLELKLYESIFNAYTKAFCSRPINACEIEQIFETNQPLTLEGLVVAIADEIAQLCHDIEDLRRIEGFGYVKEFYKQLINLYEMNLSGLELYQKEKIDTLCQELKQLIDLINTEENVAKIERIYVKIIIVISFSLIEKMVSFLDSFENLSDIPIYLGKFSNLPKISGINFDTQKIATFFEKVAKNYNELLFSSAKVAKWDIKGKELIKELCEKLLSIFKNTKKDRLNLSIFPKEQREDLLKSYEAGNSLIKDLNFIAFLKREELYPDSEDIIREIPIKFIIWDYVAGMTDSYIIREFESITFKKVSFD